MKKKASIISGIIGVFLFIQILTAQTWTADKRLTWNSGSSLDPAIAEDSNDHIHLVWEDNSSGNWEIYYKRYLAVGARWITKRLTYSFEDSMHPAIAIDSNDKIHLVWQDYTPGNREIYYKNSKDGGASWGNFKRLTWNAGSSHGPAIAVDSTDCIHVVWEDDTPGFYEIFYKKSKDGGLNWTTKRLTWNLSHSLCPAIAIDSNDHIHLVWTDDAPGNFEIFYKKSIDGGSSWTTKRQTLNSGHSGCPAIAVDSNNHIYVVWNDDTPGNMEIYFRTSTDGGTVWTQKRLTYNFGDSRHPAIAIDSNDHIYMVWSDNTPGNLEIFYKKCKDGGTLWTTKRLTYKPEASYSPAIAIDSNNHIHVAWEDLFPANIEIYYKKGIQ